MIKSILFIYMELFTIRYAKKYSKQHLFNVRQLFYKIVSDYEFGSISAYLELFRELSAFLDSNEFSIVIDFHRYLSFIDKLVKM